MHCHAADSERAGITITTAATQVTFPRKRFRSAHAAYRAWSSRIGPCILLMLPQLDQDLEQRPVSLQPTDDGLKIGPEVMPVSSVALSDGPGRENARRPVLRGLGSSALAQGTQIALIWVASTGRRAGVSAVRRVLR